MKKKIVSIILASALIGSFVVGCGNKTFFDTTYTFDYAIISLPNGEVVEGEIKEWCDYEDGDQLQIKMKDGSTYLVHAEDCVLIAD